MPPFEAEIRASSDKLSGLRHELRAWLDEAGVSDTVAQDIVLAATEAAANAIEHAHAETKNGTVTVAASISEGDLQLTIDDTGSWRPPQADSIRGRGIQLMDAVMDQTSVQPSSSGTRISMSRRLDDPEAPCP